MACIVTALTNGEDSILYKTLEGLSSSEEQSNDFYKYFIDNEEFKKDFGDWEADFKESPFERTMSKRVDNNGEPKLFYDNKLKKYYYINNVDTKIFYPVAQSKLEDIFSKARIKGVSKALALGFFNSRIDDNFNDIDLTERSGTLRDFIIDKFKERISTFENSGDIGQIMNATLLQDSLLSVDEWVEHVVNHFAKINLEYKESTESDLLQELETSERGQQFGVSSFERSTKTNVSSNVKLRLSLIPNIDELDETLLEPMYAEFDEIYTTLLPHLTNKTAIEGDDLFLIMMDEIAALSTKKPKLKELHRLLSESNDYVKAEFVQAFNLHRNNFIGSIYSNKIIPVFNKVTNELEHKVIANFTVQNFSDVGAKHKIIKNHWFFNFVKNFANDVNVIDASSKTKFKNIKKDYDTLFHKLNKNFNKENFYDAETLPVQPILDTLNSLGMVTTEKGLNHYLDGLKPEIAPLHERVARLKTLTSSLRFFINKLAGEKFNPTEGENIFNDQTAFNDVAKAQAFFLKEGSDSSIFTVSKTKWVYSYPSYISSKIQQWKNNRQILTDHYNTTYNKGSHFMHYLLALDIEEAKRKVESDNRLEEFEVNIFNSFQKDGEAINAVDNKEISKIDAYADTYHKLLGFRVKGKNSFLNTATPADKSTLMQLKVPDGLMVDTQVEFIDGNIRVNEKTQNIIKNYIVAEYNRINDVTKEIKEAGEDESKLRAFYHLGPKNGLKFQLLPSLNSDIFDAKESGFELYNEDGSIIEGLNFDEDVLDKALKVIINNLLSKRIESTYKHMIDIGLVDRNSTGKVINAKISSDIWNSYENNHALGIASDVFVNGLLSQVEYSKMFAGDIAYYKNSIDYKKRIPAAYTDGLQLYLKPGEENYTVSIISDVEVATPYIEELTELIGEDLAKHYKNIDSTDAQAWITPERWKFLKQRLGKWSNAHDVVYSKLTGENNIEFTNTELKLAAQPVKGVYFEINDGVPVFLKYSQAVLVPSIVKNNEGFRLLVEKMKAAKVDELITFQGIKVGALKPSTVHTADFKVDPDAVLTPLKLKNSGWKLQQDLPVKTFKETAVGSQIQKNILSAMSNRLDEIFNVGDKEMTGRELITYINNITEHLSDKGFTDFENEFDINQGGTINNIDRLNSVLIKELIQRGAPQNVINALKANINPFGIPGYSQKLQNIFASITLDRIVKIKTNGGAFIQMSNYGFNKSKAEANNVIWTPWSKDTPHEYEYVKDEDGNVKKSESGKPIIRPAGILLSGSFIAKYIPEYRRYSPEKLFGTKAKNYKDAKLSREIIETIVGYRIPNQALASNDALEVVGILPEEMGDTVVAYTGITTKTGSDFDIDKMYLMFPNMRPVYTHKNKLRDYAYTYLRGNNIQDTIDNITKITDQISDDTVFIDATKLGKILLSSSNKDLLHFEVDNFVEAVLHHKTELTEYIKKSIPDYDKIEGLRYVKGSEDLKKNSIKELQNKLIEAYKGALLQDNVIKETMTPIDFPFIKDDIVNLFPVIPLGDFDVFDINKEVALKFEFNAGKAGVGITANALMDHIRGTMANISLFQKNLGIGHVLGDETTFDREFSQELTDEDMKYYLKAFNQGKSIKDQMSEEHLRKSLKKIKIDNSLSAFLNAFVDIAKDPYVTRGNWTTQTSNTGFMLLRAGVHPFYVNAILAQPIVKDYVDFTINKESIIGNNSGDIADKFIKDKTLEEFKKLGTAIVGDKSVSYVKIFETTRGFELKQTVLNKLVGTKSTTEQYEVINKMYEDTKSKFVKPKKVNFDVGSLKKLRGNVHNPNVDYQLGLFYQFLEWQQESKKLVNSINASKVDVNGYGKNSMDMTVANNLKSKMLDKVAGGINNFESKLTFAGEKSILGVYTDNILSKLLHIMKANLNHFMFTHPTLVKTFNHISLELKNEILVDKRLAGKLEKSYTAYLMSGFTPFQLTNDEKKDILRDTLTKVNKLKNEKSTNLLIEELDLIIGSKGRKYLSMNNRKKSISEQEDITNAWLDLLEEDPELGEDLVKYSFLTSGFQMNKNQFYSYIPYEWFVKNNINEYINGHVEKLSKEDMDANFIPQFYKHNVDDNQIVRTIFDSDIVKKYSKNINGFVIDGTYDPLYVKKLLVTEERAEPFTHLYKRIGYDVDNKAVYIRDMILGLNDKGNKVVEFDMQSNGDESIAIDNKLPIKFEVFKDYFQKLVVTTQVEKSEDATIDDTIEESTKTIKVLEVPKEREYTPDKIETLKENEVFVFGSNEGSSKGGKPTHGRGAALIAKNKFGAIQGRTKGLQGQSYAIVTKKFWDVEKSSTLAEIEDGIKDFILDAYEMKTKKFYVTKIGTSLAGYTNADMKDIFKRLNEPGLFELPDNIILPKEFEVRDIYNTSQGNIKNKEGQLDLFADNNDPMLNDNNC